MWLGWFGMDGLMKGELVGGVQEMVWRGLVECRSWYGGVGGVQDMV